MATKDLPDDMRERVLKRYPEAEALLETMEKYHHKHLPTVYGMVCLATREGKVTDTLRFIEDNSPTFNEVLLYIAGIDEP